MAYYRINGGIGGFKALVTVSANPNATITVTGTDTGKVYTEIANEDGIAIIRVERRDTYIVSTSELATITATIVVRRNQNYNTDVYVVPAGSATLTSSGIYSIPNYVYKINVFCVGGGGGGGGGGHNYYYGSTEDYYTTTGGAGGGGGYCTKQTISVTPQQQIAYAVGGGGGGSTPSYSSYGSLNFYPAGNGGQTVFGSVTANGGAGAYTIATLDYEACAGSGGAGGGKGGFVPSYWGEDKYKAQNGGSNGASTSYTRSGCGVGQGSDAVTNLGIVYAGGGAGGTETGQGFTTSSKCSGGNRGGGNGGGNVDIGANGSGGTANTGGGAGGGGGCYQGNADLRGVSTGGTGGSGVIVVSWNKGGH